MTTLELAHAIAHAVWLAQHPPGPGGYASQDLTKDPGTQAVLLTLHETGHWFCRLETGPQGETVDVPLAHTQPDLFTVGRAWGARLMTSNWQPSGGPTT